MSARPRFLMGNKRSGSTLLVNLLNAHPRIFVSHESDIIWILYRASTGDLDYGECHLRDAARGLQSTLGGCRSIIEGGASDTAGEYDVVGTFHRVLAHLNRHGSDIDKPLRKSDLACIGDKMPVEHGDPRLRGSIRKHFPSARHLHAVRNPKGAVASISRAAAQWKVVPDHWKGCPLDLPEQWATHERWVLG